MAEVVKMPKLSDTMVEGVVAEWHKKVGDKVETGDLLAEIETDKATMEFESFQEGVLLHIGVEKGKAAEVDAILAILGEEGEDISEILEKAAAEKADANEEEKEVKEAPKEDEKPKVEEQKSKPTPAPTKTVTKSTPVNYPSASQDNGRVIASPLAKKLAEERNINLKLVRGTGEGGRIVKRDIDNFTGGTSFSGVESYRDEPVSQMRKVIAQRLGESKFTAPHFYLTISIDMDNAIAARKSINAQIAPEKISFNDLVIKACAEALKEHPQVNAGWHGDFIRFNDHVHIGVAVAVPEGLLVPVIRFADGKTLTQIGGEVKELAGKAKDKKLQPEDWAGNTFTISNLGMFGIEEFTAIINPPDACILAVGGIQQTPVVKNGQIVPGNVMKVTLSCDHRVVDGAVGSAFLNTVKNYLENPVVLLGRNSI
ncbi:pyruvate dehydrogenase complex dihydrolipoamide acetyltransferase [Parvicella tangerina]|uniref:Acetyltransferase component of pyruvate dehydrogenase complex n=1 Tax=Parvicella tangerina TaxID=2829795 RepID=A0A916JLA5_9FLAO|nr:pyruvate dehydrogenase complex dihydrolipoamide acetyltransferase [Parvicella tangerina]CAG5080219.1 Dihydrolipoyllysine-residue acetyltransferase component of pyruvate dehydrogenase complex [Parvicella tangerina]